MTNSLLVGRLEKDTNESVYLAVSLAAKQPYDTVSITCSIIILQL